MPPTRKKGKGGGGGKTLAPHPDEVLGMSPPSEPQKRLPGLRTRKTEEAKFPEDEAYGSSNLAAAVLRSFQREKGDRRNSLNLLIANSHEKSSEDASDENTPKLVEVVAKDKPLPEVPQKKPVRSVSRGKETGSKILCKEERVTSKSRDFGDERRVGENPRRSVSAQPMRECRHREPFDCSSKIGTNVGLRDVHRGVARVFLKSSTRVENLHGRKSDVAWKANVPVVMPMSKAFKQESNEEITSLKNAVTLPGSDQSSEVTVRKEAAGGTVCKEVNQANVGKSVSTSESLFSTALQERLALLEEKVSQLATELKDTKELLHANNPVNNKVLSDIQLKISNIEKAVTSRMCDERCQAGNMPAQLQEESRVSLSTLDDTDLEGRKSSTFSRHKILEERMLPHLTLLKDRPSLHQKLLEGRAALQQKLVENRALLRSKIAALEGHEVGNTEGDVIASEFLASLKQSQALAEQKEMESVRSTVVVDVENISLKVSENVGERQNDGLRSKCSPETLDKPSSDSSSRKNASERKRRNCEISVSCPLEADTEVYESSGSFKSANTSTADIVINSSFSLECDETFLSDEPANDQENAAPAVVHDGPAMEVAEIEPELCPLGNKVAMAGWFVYEGEGILLAHEDGSCSFYDVANMEEKTQYMSPEGMAPAIWRDCWLIRAAGSDGRSNKYVVAASAGTAVDPAFCSWNFYEKTVAAYHSETPSWPVTPSTSYSNKSSINLSPDSRMSPKDRLSLGTAAHSSTSGSGSDELMASPSYSTRGLSSELDFPLWWYKPCGPLMASGGSGLKTLALYDIRDGDLVMKWDTNRSIASMDYSSPIQWRSKNTVLVAEDEGISVWDISNSEPQCIQNLDLAGNRIQALHIYNSDGECNGGVRQRISSNDTCGIDGIFATQEAVNVLDFRVASGLALKIPTFGQSVHSLYSRGDAVFAGVTGPKKSMQCTIHQWSIRKAKPMLLYTLPHSASSHQSQLEISQVWGSTDSVMAINGNGLFIFDTTTGTAAPRAVIGSDDLYCPSFDYSGSNLLLISRDRPASWQYWP